MHATMTLPAEIAIFPLEGALLLPRARLPLHVFEPRYLAMIDNALKTPERLIGIIQPLGDDLRGVGCAGRITSFTETEDNRYMVTLTGISRFVLGQESEGFTPYRRFQVDWSPYAGDARRAPGCGFDRPAFFALLKRYFELRGLESDWQDIEAAEDELLVNSLAILCPFTPDEKQMLLEDKTLSARCRTLIALMEFACRAGPLETMQ